MSISAETRIVTECRSDECAVCGREAAGAVTHDDRADPFCGPHALDVMAAALLSEPTTGPAVTVYDIDSYRTSGWGAA